MEERLDKLLAQSASALQVLNDIRTLATEARSKVSKAQGGGMPNPGKSGKPDGGMLSDIGSFAGKMGGMLTAALAFIAMPAMMTAAVASFVRALNPGLMAQFEQVMSNLQATIGYGLEPVIAQAIQTVQQWAGMLMPMMAQLRPVMAAVAHMAGEVLVGALAALTPVITITITILEHVVRYLELLISVISQTAEVVGMFYETVFSLIGALLESIGVMSALDAVFDTLKTVASKVAQAFGYVVAMALRLVGAMETLAKFKGMLEKRIADRKAPGGGLAAAPKDVGTSGVEDIAKRMSERAFAAVGAGGAAKSDTDLLEDILSAVKDAESMDLGKLIKDGVKGGIEDFVKKAPGGETIVKGAKWVDRHVDDLSAAGGKAAAGDPVGAAKDLWDKWKP